METKNTLFFFPFQNKQPVSKLNLQTLKHNQIVPNLLQIFTYESPNYQFDFQLLKSTSFPEQIFLGDENLKMRLLTCKARGDE